MARRLACALMGALALALPNAAVGATPGHYQGTNEHNYPIEFDVAADGASLTNVVTTANASCNGGPAGPGALRQLSTDS